MNILSEKNTNKKNLLTVVLTSFMALFVFSSIAIEKNKNIPVNKLIINKSVIDKPILAYMSTVQPVWAKNGMVSSVSSLATDIGVEILKQGGNAVDAAVAVGFALAVTYPRAGNIGGGGFMVIHLAETKDETARDVTIDYREMAPSKAHKNLFLDKDENVIKNMSLFHGASSGIPGSVMGMEQALKQFGTMSLEQVVKPAINLAENGFKVSYDFANSIRGKKSRFSKWPSSQKIFFKENGDAYKAADIFYQKDLAKTLSLIAKKGSDGFYKGEIAKKIVSSVNNAGGIFTLKDFANYKAIIREPIKGDYRGYEILSMPPPSSGGIHLVQILNILENSDLTNMGHNSAKTIHQMAEAMKYAYADRSEYLGDPDFYEVPVKALISKSYAEEIYSKIIPNKVRPSSEIKPGNLSPYESDQTTHYSVIDQWGNAVSTTTTLNFSYGSAMVADGTGVLMNNEMDDFSAKQGVPNAYGLLGGEANSVQAGKRPLSAMTPTIVLKNGEVYLVTGSPGGSRIITTTLQIILNVIDHQMNIGEATFASRIHHQWFPEEIRIERDLNVDTIQLLKLLGHHIKMKAAMGSTQSIMRTRNGFFGASDPRSRDGKAAGF
ncbi:MAG: gamma-glutamyltranspeptidase/glutathione hydrolase [Polaribacter sp.]|jgi:gamma-glutamyltranspeptidase/glutathione hydrolase